jgi:hypothetical protein
MLVRDIQHHIIGDIDKGVFTKMVSGSKHFLRNPEPSIAIDAVAFDTVISRHTNRMLVIDRDSKAKYEIRTRLFSELKEELDRGYGRQYYVPIRLWDNTGSLQRHLI